MPRRFSPGSQSAMNSKTSPPVLPAELSARLFGQARTINLARDQILFTAGDLGDGFYLLNDGLLKVTVISPGGAERILSILGPGAMVGELSMIDGTPRSATVAAIREFKLAFVSKANFDAFSRSHPELNLHIMTVLARRLRDVDEALTATSLLPLKGASCPRTAELGGGFREGCRVGSHPHPPKSEPVGHCRHGGRSREKMSAASCRNGPRPGWSAGCRATTALRKKQLCSASRRSHRCRRHAPPETAVTWLSPVIFLLQPVRAGQA